MSKMLQRSKVPFDLQEGSFRTRLRRTSGGHRVTVEAGPYLGSVPLTVDWNCGGGFSKDCLLGKRPTYSAKEDLDIAGFTSFDGADDSSLTTGTDPGPDRKRARWSEGVSATGPGAKLL